MPFLNSRRRAVDLLLSSVFAFAAVAGCDLEDTEPEAPIDAPTDIAPTEAELLAEFELPNSNSVRFFGFPDGGVVAQEAGGGASKPIAGLPELANVTPLELFRAVAPEGTEAPAELVADHEAAIAEREATGTPGSMPADFRVDRVPGFFDAPTERAFSGCTDDTAWQNHDGGSPVGPNCVAPPGTSYIECVTNFNPPPVSACGGVACQEAFYNGSPGYRTMRSSLCARAGTGAVFITLAMRTPGTTPWTTLMSTSLTNAGQYVYYWYSHGSIGKEFSRTLSQSYLNAHPVNKSIWVKP